jgi:hypothetical protein
MADKACHVVGSTTQVGLTQALAPMTRRFLIFAIFAVVAHGVFAQDTGKFISARPSPLKRAGVIEPNETFFKGQIRITGSFDVIWEPGTEGYPGYFRVVLRPDKPSREILPHDSERGVVREIWLRNTDTAIRTFLGPAQRKSLMSSHTRHATGQVTVLLSSYRTGVDCDQRGYNAVLVSVVQRPTKVIAGSPVVEQMDGC